MIPIEEAEHILNSIQFSPAIEEVPILTSLGRVLAQDVVSEIYMPPFDKSAMDGYALKKSDDSPRFRVVEIIAAGSIPTHEIHPGECAKIMTGAMLPPGAERIVKIEVTTEKDGFMTITGEDKHSNICTLGEDVKPGDLILPAKRIIRPQEIGIIASMGLSHVKVFKRVAVGIITTGSEIVEPGLKLATGQIYNSNGYSLAAQVTQTGAIVKHQKQVNDIIPEIKQEIDQLLTETQVLLISGGVSMGDFDFVPAILKELGIQMHFSKVAIQPGKPTVFGTRGNHLIFGMPGNPVSTFTIFEIFVKPILYKAMGLDFQPAIWHGTLKKEYSRKHTERTAYIPVKMDPSGAVEPVEYHGSAHFNALAQADGLMEIQRGVRALPKGNKVHVRQI